MKIQDMLFTEIGVLLVSKVEELVDNIELNYWMKRRERTIPIMAFDYGFLTQETADTFPILICRDSRYGQTGATCCERKVPQHTPFHFLLVSSKILVFAESFSKCDNEPSTTSLQDAVIRACAGVEVIPRGPPVGDHMANVRVEIALREVKRCAEHSGFQLNNRQMYASQTTVRCSAGFTALRWKTSELRRTGRRWRKPMAPFGETVRFCKIGEDVVSSFARAHDLRILCLSS